MSWWVPPRSGATEAIDLETTDDAALRREMASVAKLNGLFGYHSYLISALKRMQGRFPEHSLDVLDLATGSADVPVALARWARRSGRSLRLLGVDINPRILAMARERVLDYPEIALVQADAFALPFPEGSFDWITSHLAFHHLPPERIPELIRALDRLVRPGGGMLIGDLVRSWPNYWLVTAAVALLGDRVALADGQTSVLNSFTRAEWRAILEESGISYLGFHPLPFPTQVLITGKKPR